MLKTFHEIINILGASDVLYNGRWRWLNRHRSEEEEAIILLRLMPPVWTRKQVGKVELTIPARVLVEQYPDKKLKITHTTTTIDDARRFGKLTPAADHEVFEYADRYLPLARFALDQDTMCDILRDGKKSLKIQQKI